MYRNHIKGGVQWLGTDVLCYQATDFICDNICRPITERLLYCTCTSTAEELLRKLRSAAFEQVAALAVDCNDKRKILECKLFHTFTA